MKIISEDITLEDIINFVHKVSFNPLELDDGKGNVVMIHGKRGKDLIVLIKNREDLEDYQENVLKKTITNGFLMREKIRGTLFHELSIVEETITFEDWMNGWTEEERELYSNQYRLEYDAINEPFKIYGE
ncbi:hypothetical protein [Tissierella pigra]|uniref:Uncharacterized protein n=1 Tax=Tissierella pigra TaxID=2607614 RepID=A0A6N7XY30_9FIRM|nr:hypothetical protein [Tissierella pigra]MSU01395.1 hypothetical protein [Tissierella pigra]